MLCETHDLYKNKSCEFVTSGIEDGATTTSPFLIDAMSSADYQTIQTSCCLDSQQRPQRSDVRRVVVGFKTRQSDLKHGVREGVTSPALANKRALGQPGCSTFERRV